MSIPIVKQFEKALVKACDKHIANGGKIIAESFTKGIGAYCPITALVGTVGRAGSGLPTIYAVSDIFGGKISLPEIWTFIYSFDGRTAVPSNATKELYPDFHKVGQKLRKKYILSKKA